jgi:flagellar biosynthetic protein FliP
MNRPALLVILILGWLAGPALAGPPDKPRTTANAPAPGSGQANAPLRIDPAAEEPLATETRPTGSTKSPGLGSLLTPSTADFNGLKSVLLIGLVSLAPAALLMFTSFVRINIVLILLRQALGSPQVPGNQVLAALALLLTLLVMKPVGESVYTRAIQPYAASQKTAEDVRIAWEAGSKPIKTFMIDQLKRTGHTQYLNTLYDIAEPPNPGRFEPSYCDEFPLRVIAPAFLLSELTTAMMIGFLIYLPFLVIDLVVSAVLSAMGLFMLPPSLVAMPLKLILFVLADGWLLVATALLRTFAV